MLDADRDYGVRVIRAFENKRVGQTLFPPAMLRGALLKRGFVERIMPPAPRVQSCDDGIPNEFRRLKKGPD